MSKPNAAWPLNIRMAALASTELGYRFEIVDPFSAYLARVSRGDAFVYVGAGNVPGYPINNATGAAISRDKAHTYHLLHEAGLPIPRTGHFFISDSYADLRPPGRTIEDAARFAATLGYPMFCKPNDGSRGHHARTVADEAALRAHLELLSAHTPIALVQEYLRGRERRIFVLDDEPVFAYVKVPPVLTGDGRTPTRALLADIDKKLDGKGLSRLNPDDLVLRASLNARGLSLDDVLGAGETLAFSERANLSIGGASADFTETFSAQERALCARISQLIGLRLCAIDLIEVDDGWAVLEVNNNPSLHTLEQRGRDDLLLRIWTQVLQSALGG